MPIDTDELVPPRDALPGYARRYAGKQDFKAAGERFLSTATRHGLEPHHRVLDVGCGVGRFAVAVAGFLDERGSYTGLDTSKQCIKLCRRWIGSKLPSFEFRRADVFNTSYNRKAEVTADRYRFPFDDGSFDFAFSNSLFTHLVPADADNYLRQIGRVLKPGGRTLNTMFLLNDESRAQLEGDSPRHDAPHALDGVARVKIPERPEAWIAFDEGFIGEGHDRAGLRIEHVRYGAWSGRESSGPGFGTKDIVVAVRA